MAKRLTKKQRKFVSDEENAAEKFLVDHIKFKGQLKYINDGKAELYTNLKWQDLIKLLTRHAIDRMTARITQLQREDSQP